MNQPARARPDPALALLEMYDAALPQVYGYLVVRCRDQTTAEDLTLRRSWRRSDRRGRPALRSRDSMLARSVLAGLTPYREALSLRYLDGLPVAEVAALLERTVHATEALLVRARREFRATYPCEEGSA